MHTFITSQVHFNQVEKKTIPISSFHQTRICFHLVDFKDSILMFAQGI